MVSYSPEESALLKTLHSSGLHRPNPSKTGFPIAESYAVILDLGYRTGAAAVEIGTALKEACERHGIDTNNGELVYGYNHMETSGGVMIHQTVFSHPDFGHVLTDPVLLAELDTIEKKPPTPAKPPSSFIGGLNARPADGGQPQQDRSIRRG